MATKEKDTNKELEVEEIVSKSEQFIENNSKKIIYGIIAVALVVGAVLGIKHGYLVPQEKKAASRHVQGSSNTSPEILSPLAFKRAMELTMKVSRLSSTNMEARSRKVRRRLTQVICYYKMGDDTRRRSIY